MPTLGVCLGHQCLAHVFGIRWHRHHRLMHGKTSWIDHDGRTVFAGLANPFLATRYHSLIVDPDSVPSETWEITARSEEGEVMGLRHKRAAVPLEGVQFHPESFLTTEGPKLLANFLNLPRPDIEEARPDRSDADPSAGAAPLR